jgi:3-dehydroquinate synthase
MRSTSQHTPATLSIRSLQWDYEVDFADTINEALEKLGDVPEACVVIDAEVERLHGAALRPMLDRYPALVVEPSEEAKSLRGVERLVDWLIEQRVVRSGTVIAVGGGCIQDLVSFTSHIYYRGIDWIFLPTTVLSQADSCIGAKSGINVLPFKNQLGVLHSPRRILVAKEFLNTLPNIEIASGYGEIVKLSVTSSRHFLPFLEGSLAKGGLRNGHLLELERAALAAKQEIIEEDEYEVDLRRVLNYGHSFGHALEALSGHKVPHGLAVLWGIDVINALGVRWGCTPLELASRLHVLVKEHFDYVLPMAPSARDLVEVIGRDKKVARGLMNFVVLRAEGDMFVLPRPLDGPLLGEVEEVLQGRSELGELVFARR